MGFPTDLFIVTPDSSLICPVCKDMFEEPKTTPCGHSFCQGCLDSAIDAYVNEFEVDKFPCPTCREDSLLGDEVPSLTIRSLVRGMTVKCKHILPSDEEQARLVRGAINSGKLVTSGCSNQNEANDGDGADEAGRRVRCRIADSNEETTWDGPHIDWDRHNNTRCVLNKIKCTKPGCEALVPRWEMEQHQMSVVCLAAALRHELKQEMTTKIEDLTSQLGTVKSDNASLRQELVMTKIHNTTVLRESGAKDRDMRLKLVQQHLMSFCRKWLDEGKPDPLFDFVVYRDHHSESFNRLLVGIPGPKQTEDFTR